MEIVNGFIKDFDERMPIEFFQTEKEENEDENNQIRLMYFKTLVKVKDWDDPKFHDFATIKSKTYTVSSEDIENDIKIKDTNNVSYWVDYWEDMIWETSQRIIDCRELLKSKLLSEYFQYICYYKKDSISLESFFDSKRPFGNKDIVASIIYNARIDELGAMSKIQSYLPDNIKEYCLKLFENVKNELIEDKVYDYNYVYNMINNKESE